jgi:DNA-binding CsgD family transcriptional regulator
MPKSARLRHGDLRSVYNLIGECRDLGDDPAAWGSHLAAGVGRLAGASYAAALATALRTGGRLVPVGFSDWGEIDWKALRQAQTDYGTDLRFSPLIDGYLARRESADGAALCRTDLVGWRDWLRSPYYRDIHEPLRLGHTLVSFLSLPDSPRECSSFTMARTAADRRDFSAREKAIVREVNAAVAPLMGGPLARFTEPSPSELPPRARAVLRCLLEGDGDKQIATRLGVSAYTVNVHTKVIFRYFGVRSRAELLARWIRRGWGSRCAWAAPE